MKQAGISGQGLNRMAKGVAEIQNHTVTAFTLVFFDDLGLDGAGGFNDVLEAVVVQRQNACGVRFKESEQLGVGDDAVFDHLGEAGPKLVRRQGVQGLEVDDH